MKVLFVSSGNSPGKPGAIVKSQGESLIKNNINPDYFVISKKGLKGYFKEYFRLKKIIRKTRYDIIHAHYGLSALVCLFIKKKEKLVVSYMGDDILGTNKSNGKIVLISRIFSRLNKILSKYFYDLTIVKSEEMYSVLGLKNAIILPNGVNTEIFKNSDKTKARERKGLSINGNLAIFVSNPNRPEKNFELAESAINNIKELEIKLLPLFNIDHKDLAEYYNAADILLMSSFHEGSPNVIKEAMACSCPVVTTNVGDVKWVLGNTDGCFISDFNCRTFSDDIRKAFDFSKLHNRTKGRERIFELGLDSDSIAKRLIHLYQQL